MSRAESISAAFRLAVRLNRNLYNGGPRRDTAENLLATA